MAAPAQQSRKLTSSTAPKTRLGLSLAERIKVIEARQMGKSMRQLAAQFGCGKTQILNTLTQKDRYIREWEVMGRINPSIGARKRFRHTRNEQINRSVHEWYQQQTENGLRVTGPMLQKQARQFATHLGILNFGASNGWLANFRRFYNIVSCSSHPKKKAPSILPHPDNNSEVDYHQATSSKHPIAEFVPVITEYEKADRRSPRFLKSAEQDPLLDEDQQQQVVLTAIRHHLKAEPVEVIQFDCTSKTHKLISDSAMSSNPSPNLISPAEDNSSGKEELPQQKEKNNTDRNTGPSSFINHRKRRLLQMEHLDLPTTSKTSKPENNNDGSNNMKERRIPRLLPISHSGDFLTEFVSLARAKGLLTLTVKDDCGHEWVEIRHSVASYRVPQHGYPTHLSRLIVDSSLQYFLEVLGHCVQNGSLLYNDNSHSINYSEVTSVLSAVSGEYVVCAGIEHLSNRTADLHMKTIQELGQTDNMYATLPDHRYRSNECSKWIDYRFGPKCPACKQAATDLSSAPMDLRCVPTHRHKH